jgi:large subunit ribosomal protein L15
MAEAKKTTSTAKASTATKKTTATTAAKKTTAAKPAAKKTTATKATTAAKPVAKKTTAAKPAAKATTTATKAAPKTESTKVKSAAKKAAAGSKATPGLKLHHLKPAEGAHKAKTRVGRGEASKGKTAGRGTKGTKARYQVKVGFEGGQMPLHMRLPKLRGFKNPFRTEYQVVNLDRLEKFFPKGGKVTILDLNQKGLVRDGFPVKLLANGETTQKFDITVDAASKSAIAAIEKAGGSVTVVAKDTADVVLPNGKVNNPAKVTARSPKQPKKTDK